MMFILFFKAMILFGLIYTITFAPLWIVLMFYDTLARSELK
jgi:uncharacterized SAM-binding protein YcdF (DUF218 family)